MTQQIDRNPEGITPEETVMSINNPEQQHREQLPPFPTDETTELPPKENQYNRRQNSRRNKIIASGAGALLVVTGGVVGAKALFDGGKTEPKQEAGSSALANKEADSAKEQFKITPLSVEKYKNNPEGLTKAFYQEWNASQNEGMSRSEAESDDLFNYDDTDAYVSHFADPVDQSFRDTLFAPQDQLSQDAIDNITRFIAVHHTNVETAFQTSRDEEMYKRYIIPDTISVVKSPNGEITTQTQWHGEDNRDKNHAASALTGVNPNEETGGDEITWKDVDNDGNYEIIDMKPYSSND